MPQELQVLQCFNCKYFQVHIVKKKSKWACKICKEKQSIKKIFMKSENGKDCRLLVQELNLHHSDTHDIESSPKCENHSDYSGNNFKNEFCKDDSMWNQFLPLDNVNSQRCNETYLRNDIDLAEERMLTSVQNTQSSNIKAKIKLPFFEDSCSIIDCFDESEPVPKRCKSDLKCNSDSSPIKDKSSNTDSAKRPKREKPVISMFEEEFNESDLKL